MTARNEKSPPFEWDCEETIEQMVEKMKKERDVVKGKEEESKKVTEALFNEEEKGEKKKKKKKNKK